MDEGKKVAAGCGPCAIDDLQRNQGQAFKHCQHRAVASVLCSRESEQQLTIFSRINHGGGSVVADKCS